MRYYLDTEFIDKGYTVDLISIGVLSEDGRELYAISTDFDPLAASDWVRENVLANLEPRDSGCWKSVELIRAELLSFVGADEPEFWTWGGGTYDWFAVMQIVGGADNLPEGWRYYANELMQWCGQMGLDTHDLRIPEQAADAHNALADARHDRVIYEFLSRYQEEWILHRCANMGADDRAHLLQPPSRVQGDLP